jgi:hypothetical protein
MHACAVKPTIGSSQSMYVIVVANWSMRGMNCVAGAGLAMIHLLVCFHQWHTSGISQRIITSAIISCDPLSSAISAATSHHDV